MARPAFLGQDCIIPSILSFVNSFLKKVEKNFKKGEKTDKKSVFLHYLPVFGINSVDAPSDAADDLI